jgi:TonB-linked SusC/RagA family outer membrane protein
LMDATTNDYYGVAPTNYIWYKMGFLMKHAPDSAYLDMNYTYNIDPTTGQITYVGTPTTPSSNPINPGFGDVKDLTFFNTNYADLLWHNSSSTQQNISVAGRTEKAGYRLSLGYMGDGSLLAWGQNSNKRYNVRLTNDFKPIERLKIETNISLDKNDIVQPSNTGYLSQYQQPGFPVQTKNGMAYAWGTQYSANWLAALGGENKEYNTRIFSTLKSTFDFTRNFRFVGQGSYNWNITDNKVESKSINWWNYAGTIQAPDNPTQQNSSYQRQLIKDPYYNLNGYFDYQNKFNGIHTVGVTAGGNYERDEFDSYTARTTYLASNNIPSLNLGIGDNTTKTVTESMNHYAIGSFFSRFNYGFKNKYLFEANLRYDGSSKFDISNRWKAFYGFSGAWRISDESFMQKQKLFNDLKLRASWGEAGNQNGISLYDYIQLLNVSATGGATSSGFPIIGSSPAVLVSPTSGLVSLNRSWETVRTTNFGTDFTLLQNKLNGSFDYFIKNNLNMLLPQTLPAVLGATPPTANLGHLRTWGWETAIQWRDHIGNFNYHLGGSLTDNQNKLVDLKGSKIITPGYNNAVEGYAIGTYFGLKYAGRIQDQKTADDINAIFAGNQISMPAKTINSSGVITTPGVRPGDNYYLDVNGDGKFTIPGDLVPLGTDAPRYTFSFNLGADWNGFDISAIFQGVGKRTILRGYNFNSSTGLISFGDNWAVPFSSIFQGQPNYWWGQTWTTDNPGAYYPRLSAAQNANGNENLYNYYPSTWSAQNGAYIRLKNLVIGYTLPQHLLTRSGIQKLRVYFSGNDLWELTHIHDGWDPEATKDIGRVNSASAFQRYPFYRLLTAGVNVTF